MYVYVLQSELTVRTTIVFLCVELVLSPRVGERGREGGEARLKLSIPLMEWAGG